MTAFECSRLSGAALLLVSEYQPDATYRDLTTLKPLLYMGGRRLRREFYYLIRSPQLQQRRAICFGINRGYRPFILQKP